ncbi:thiamine-phosphate diphosphorylase [Alcanivorax hongdengensis A-11-3]|uniref:Thiamine-phosphate synthase n=1 Tax=Alcanivorax hongdengensis A-11-3 TaxID=1177179 RepID=L0WER5_9GAMM|nr:thiamine phosphate synthase [Alcanivorax hongdengensis]EKF75328.1 thiamine-phosphate diphosphorylase [Alcanivorax hongdengensis A-11-3]
MIHGLYAITDPQLTPDERLLPAARAALRGGARLLQYRDKTATPRQRENRAAQLRDLCHEFGALFIVNDDPALAARVHADGVHIGQSDGGLAAARDRLGEQRIIGVTCHGDARLVVQTEQAGADYLAMGRFFPSHTKPGAPAAQLEALRQACRQCHRPVVAIGGVNPDNAPQLIQAGAASVAVIHALFGHPDPADIEVAARRFSTLF